MHLIADGDSSVYSSIQETVPVWGAYVTKLECANHVCKCLRSNLEKLVDANPLYKGKNKLTKNLRIKITSAVRCAIAIRSKEAKQGNKKEIIKLLDHDIRNSIYHLTGNHENCSNFCREKNESTKSNDKTVNTTIQSSKKQSSKKSTQAQINIKSNDVLTENHDLWNAITSTDSQDESRLKSSNDLSIDLDAMMLKDINILLDRVASKSNRLIGNVTTNLAESWMHIRSKFDGGKVINRCNRGSWHTRCYGGALRNNFGPKWGPIVWEKVVDSKAGDCFFNTYSKRASHLERSSKCKSKDETKKRRWKRKHAPTSQSTAKKARLAYGPEATDGIDHLNGDQLNDRKSRFLKDNVIISTEQIANIEKNTRNQSSCDLWKKERRVRLTASNFGSIVNRNPNLPIHKIIKNLLYTTFRGNYHTKNGLKEEIVTKQEYKKLKSVNVMDIGFIISETDNFLGASADGKVVLQNGQIGLVEIKNLLHNKPIDLNEAAKRIKSFCLQETDSGLKLKNNHTYYFQIQGQMNIINLPWVDFIVRTLNPYQIHIERVYKDHILWTTKMLPKLKAFYYEAMLPELASPLNGSPHGIREPGSWVGVKYFIAEGYTY